MPFRRVVRALRRQRLVAVRRQTRRRSPSRKPRSWLRSGSRAASSQALSYALMMGLFGFIMPGIDNYAHAGGFGGGYLAGMLLDPLKRERVDHIAIALVCLAASLISVVASVVHGVQFLR